MRQARPDNAEVMVRHIEALYVHNGKGRITAINQWDGGVVPRFHLGRTSAGNVYRLRQDIPDELADALTRYCGEEPPIADLKNEPRYHQTYARLLSEHAPIVSITAGPAYRFPNDFGSTRASAVLVDSRNAHMLRGGMEDWLPDVPHRQPFLAVVEDGHVVSVCVSARITDSAHEAGVETLYSTSWENAASQNVARRLDLETVGSDYVIT